LTSFSQVEIAIRENAKQLYAERLKLVGRGNVVHVLHFEMGSNVTFVERV